MVMNNDKKAIFPCNIKTDDKKVITLNNLHTVEPELFN